jgi:hypothetical protein
LALDELGFEADVTVAMQRIDRFCDQQLGRGLA